VKNIPSTDLATIERLWQRFSGGKFGYSVQAVSLQISFEIILYFFGFRYFVTTKRSPMAFHYRKNGGSQRVILKYSAEKLGGIRKMAKSNGR
jgi:hypothetical protein